MSIVLRLYRISEKIKNNLFRIWLSYLAGISVEQISDSASFNELIHNVFDLSKVSIILLWIGAIAVALIWIFNLLFDKIKFSTKCVTAELIQIINFQKSVTI